MHTHTHIYADDIGYIGDLGHEFEVQFQAKSVNDEQKEARIYWHFKGNELISYNILQ